LVEFHHSGGWALIRELDVFPPWVVSDPVQAWRFKIQGFFQNLSVVVAGMQLIAYFFLIDDLAHEVRIIRENSFRICKS